MRIAIDLQAAQAGSMHRGIGRYAMALAKAIARHRGEHDIVVVLSAAFPESIARIRQAFDGLLPPDKIRVWYPIGLTNFLDPQNAWPRQCSELLREAFFSRLKPDVVLVGSLFEGLTDDAVTSVGRFDTDTCVVSILYDLIPYIYPDIYLPNGVVTNWYHEKLAYCKRADLLLAISDSSRGEALRYLATPPDRVVSISAAIDEGFQPLVVDAVSQQTLRTRLGIPERFVLYTGGIDHRKNIEGLIRAFALLPEVDRAQLQLAVVCAISDEHRVRLGKLVRQSGLQPEAVVFTGFVPDDDLRALYNLCELFVFPSWHEGFGLPALEAMACGKAVIASNCTSLPEVLGRADALFDPHDDRAIADKMAQVLSDPDFRKTLERHGVEQAQKFSWDACAQAALTAITAHRLQHTAAINTVRAPTQRPKLAYVSPLPPQRSGISDYSAELLPVLATYYDIDVVLSQDSVGSDWIAQHCTLRSVAWLQEHADTYDRVLYHFGNSNFHQHMLELVVEVPGVVVLHDFFLSGLIAYLDRTGQAPGAWDDALYNSHGYQALVERHSYGVDGNAVIAKYPCNLAVLQAAHGVIVHSKYARRLAHQWYGESVGQNWADIPLLRTAPSVTSENARQAIRAQLGYRMDQLIVCSFGFVASTKLSQKILEAWLQSPLAQDERCVLVFVGATDVSAYSDTLLSSIKRSKAKHRIHVTGWASTELYQQYLAIADVGVQLRAESRGETSAAVLDCMNYGVATVVNAHGSMADLPRDAVYMLDDHFDNRQLADALETLHRDEAMRAHLGERSMALLRDAHDPQQCAAQYHDAIESFYADQKFGIQALLTAMATVDGDYKPTSLAACALDQSLPCEVRQRQILLDITELVEQPDSTRLAWYAPLFSVLATQPLKCRLEPVYLKQGAFHYARKYTLQALALHTVDLADGPIVLHRNDCYVGKLSDQKSESIQEITNIGGAAVFVEDQWLADANAQLVDLIARIDSGAHGFTNHP